MLQILQFALILKRTPIMEQANSNIEVSKQGKDRLNKRAVLNGNYSPNLRTFPPGLIFLMRFHPASTSAFRSFTKLVSCLICSSCGRLSFIRWFKIINIWSCAFMYSSPFVKLPISSSGHFLIVTRSLLIFKRWAGFEKSTGLRFFLSG